MLSTLREKKTIQFFMWVLIAAFLGTIFIAWGAGSTLSRNANDRNLVAKVGDQKITYDDFNKIYQPQLDRLYNMIGDSPSADEISNLKKHVVDSLIENAIIDETAAKLGITVSDEELASDLQRQPYFADSNGKFSKEKYVQVLQSNQLTPAQFEASERAQLLLQKTRSILNDGVLYTPDEMTDYKSFLDRQLKVDYVSLNPSDYEKAVTYTEDDLKDFYQAHKAEYDHPERRKVRHILLMAQGSANPLESDKAEKTLEDYRNQVLSGKATFSSLAEKYSDDKGSKKNGGDLGWVTKGEMVKEFEDAVFSAKKGDITKPFKSQYGYHIAQIVDVEKEHKTTFAEVRAKVLSEYKKTKADQRLLVVASQLGDYIKNKQKISDAAKALKLNVTETSWFSQGQNIPGLKDSKSFSSELINMYPGQLAGPFPLNKKEYFFEIADAKEGAGGKKDDQATNINQRFMASHSSDWFKDFIEQQKKVLDIKNYMNS